MPADLFFVPILAAALDEPDRRAAWVSAFEEIRRRGEQRRYRRGYRQFLHWMQVVGRAREDFERARASRSAGERLDRPAGIALVIERGDARLATLRIVPGETSIIRCIAPGPYRFRLDTGALLWEGVIAERGAFVRPPEPGGPFRLAAATPALPPRDTELRLLDGALVLSLRLDGPVWLLDIRFPGGEEA